MLNGIINIKPGSGYENSNNKLKYSPYYLHKIFEEKDNLNDSVILSPALQFLIQANWKLKELKHTKSLLNIIFKIDDFEFQTEIDMEKINPLSQIYYRVSVQLIPQENTELFQAKLIYYFNDQFEFKFNKIKPAAIKQLFERFWERGNYSVDYIDNKDFIYGNILEGIEDELNDEFDRISSILCVFIEKFSGIKIFTGKGSDEPVLKNLIILDMKKIPLIIDGKI